MAEIILVRHGKTAGNLEGRYIGSRTDEPLCEEGIHALEEKVREGTYPPVDLVYASPMIRCRQTQRSCGLSLQILLRYSMYRICRNATSAHLKTKIIRNCPVMQSIRRGSTATEPCRFPEASPMKHFGSGAARRFSVSQKDCRSRKRRQGRHFGQQW